MTSLSPIAIPRAVAAITTLSLSFIIAYQIYSTNLLPLEQNPVTRLSTQSDDCSSRVERTSSPKYPSPSPHLTSRLREYEQRHKACEPLSDSFNRNSKELTGRKSPTSPERSRDVEFNCRYVLYTPINGLGNRMLDIASAFLFGNQFRNKKEKLVNVSSVLKLHLTNECDPHDWRFFEGESQELLRTVPWLVLASDQYFVPYLFLMSGFRMELDRMFPDKETIFHHLGRYLFNPSNEVWGLVTRFHETYLAKADQRIGVHVRVVRPVNISTTFLLNRILKCTQDEARVLPRLQQQQNRTKSPKTRTTSKAVLVASLSEEFYSELKSIFWTKSTVNVDEEVAVGVYQTSHEDVQLSLDNSHNMKALADMYLLSMCDVLVTSPGSTFGYVAQSLGNLKPWVLEIYPDQTNVTGSCAQPVSKEPCYHFRPMFWEKKVPASVALPRGGFVSSDVVPLGACCLAKMAAEDKFRWRIRTERLSQYARSEIRLPSFSFKGHQWKIRIEKKGGLDSDCMSLHPVLELADPNPAPGGASSFVTDFRFTIVSRLHPSRPLETTFIVHFNGLKRRWDGSEIWVDLERRLKYGVGLLTDDALIFEARFCENLHARVYSDLLVLRTAVNEESGVRSAANYILLDTTLQGLSKTMPRTKKDLLNEYGLGTTKVSKYGDRILQTIASAVYEYNRKEGSGIRGNGMAAEDKFIWKIENFSTVTEPEIHSPTFSLEGHQ
ncbi:Fucosyltransferase 2 [Linum grandiflorum]